MFIFSNATIKTLATVVASMIVWSTMLCSPAIAQKSKAPSSGSPVCFTQKEAKGILKSLAEAKKRAQKLKIELRDVRQKNAQLKRDNAAHVLRLILVSVSAGLVVGGVIYVCAAR